MYRLVAAGTLENAVMRRQVIKSTVSLNVIDQDSILHNLSERDRVNLDAIPSDDIVLDVGSTREVAPVEVTDETLEKVSFCIENPFILAGCSTFQHSVH